MSNDHGEYVELYGEYVSLKELGIASTIAAFFAFLFYGISTPVLSSKGLDPRLRVVFGVIGAAIGFLVSSLFIRPKRVLVEE